MMDSFEEAQNSLERISDGGCATLFETWQSHTVCFSFISVVMKSPGLKPIEAQNARRSSARVSCLRQQLPVLGINEPSRLSDAEGGMAEDPLCLYVLSIEGNDLGTKGCSSARRNLLSRNTFGPFVFA